MKANPQSAGLSLRERQAQQLRQELLDCFLQLTLERGLDGFTMQDVADAAGVSVRTLYRHFPKREAFLDEADAQTERALAERRGAMHDWRNNPDFFAETFAVFEENRKLLQAAMMLSQQGKIALGRQQRTDLLRRAIDEEEQLDETAKRQLVGLIRLLTSADAWNRMTAADIGLDAREAGHAVQWAVETLIEAAKREDGPLTAHRPATQQPTD